MAINEQHYVILDGEILKHTDTQIPIYSQRAAKYGDAFFETIKLQNSKALYLHLHFERAKKTATLLKFDFPESWNVNYFESLIQKICQANKISNGKINLLFSRDTEGLYLPSNKSFRYFMSLESLDEELYVLNEKGLNIGEYRELIKNSNFTSTLKTSNALIYVLAAIYAKHHQFDECLIFNEAGRVAECISSNIMLVIKDKIVTPPFSEYGLDGVMKKVIIQKAEAYGYLTEQYPIYAEDLFAADEVWCTNVMKGLQWVGEYRGKTYQNAIAKNVVALLNK